MRTPFERLDPPEGGLERLRSRLEGHDADSNVRPLLLRPLPMTITAVIFSAVLAAILLPPGTPQRSGTINQDFQAHPAWISLGFDSPPAETVTIAEDDRDRLAVAKVYETDEVVIYQVGRLERDQKENGEV